MQTGDVVPDRPTTPDAVAATSSDALFAACYERLKHIASRQLAHGRRGTLDTTMLVHELYLRVCEGRELAFEHPVQFFSYAARAMRHLLLDRARDRMRQKAGGAWVKVTLTGADGLLASVESAQQALALDEALTQLERTDARAAQVVALRWLAGVPPERIAQMLGLTRRTVDRDWQFARALLLALLQ